MQTCSREEYKNEALLPGQGGYNRELSDLRDACGNFEEAYDEAK